MELTMLPVLRRFAAYLPTLLTLGVLAAVAYWGYRNDWSLPSFARVLGTSEAPAAEAPEATTRVVLPSSGASDQPARVKFASPEAVRKAGIQVAPARQQTVAQYVTGTAMVDYEPSCYARLTARASGTIWGVYKEVGQPLKKGDVLALIDAAEVGKAKADLLQDLAQVRTRTTALERVRSLGQEGATSERSLLDAEAALREARIRVFNDQQALLNLGLHVRLEDLESLPDDQLVRRLRLLGLPAEVLKDLDPETLTANLLPLTAPFDGVVVQRDVAPGEVIQGTIPKTLFIVADVTRLHIDLNINPEDMAGVRLGLPVTFRTDNGGVEARCQVSHISPEVDEKTRRVVVHAEVDNKDGRLRPNAFGTGRILLQEHPDTVVVPREAVQTDGSNHLVFVKVSEVAFEARPVVVGLHDGDLVEVRGVQSGEEVVTTGSFALRSELQKDRITGGDEG
jgi:cobalt-zinc-cadmium efflux system membrane fusion protein